MVFRVFEKEKERKIKSYRAPGRPVSGYSSSNLSAHLDRDVSVTTLRKDKEEEENTNHTSDKPRDCDNTISTIIPSPLVKVEPFSNRNQFDRASQLRRSRKKSRRRSEAGNTSTASHVSDLSSLNSSQQEKMFSSSRAEYSSNYGNLI